MELFKEFLSNNKCFKLVCGAGNEDINEVEKLVYVYSLAGCNVFDLSANIEVIRAAKSGLKRAGVFDNRFLCVSVGIKGDPHINKASIDKNLCSLCQNCIQICPQGAINPPKVKISSCIGCQKCEKICQKNAITMKCEEKNLNEVLPPIIKEGIDCIEFHATIENEKEVIDKWNNICNLYEGILSICVDRSKLGNDKLIARIKTMIKNRGPYTTIIQADGVPMSGGCDDYKTTLQAVAMAEIISDAKLPVYVMLSGGTNSKTSELAKLCNIKYSGIAVGTYARQIIKQYIKDPDFYNNSEIIKKAVSEAKKLVETIHNQ